MLNKLITLVLLVFVLAACSPAASTTLPQAAQPTVEVEVAEEMTSIAEVEIDAADFSFTAPDTISAGWVRVKLTNSGAEPHHVQFMRLNDGVTYEQFGQALMEGEGPALALVKQMGGVGPIVPSGSASAVLNLTPGNYALMCFIPSEADQVPHLAKGMIKNLTVEPASGVAAEEPTASLTVQLMDFHFDMPETLPVGKSVIKVINDGPEPHEFNIVRLAEGKTIEDLQKFLSGEGGPLPFVPVGGMNGLEMGLYGYAEVDLQPGDYIAICNIPSPKAEGMPHFGLGMIQAFTVGSTTTSMSGSGS
jgi:uncharacterized cupredoxin-like copper-binding protein